MHATARGPPADSSASWRRCRANVRSLVTLARFFRRFLRYRGPLLMGLVCIPLAQLADVAITLLVGDALDRAQDAPDAEWMGHVLTWMAVYAVGHSILRFYQRWLIVVVSRRVEVDLKRELLDKLTSLPFAFHDRSRSGDVVSRLTSDVEAVRMTLGPGLMYTLGAVVIVPISLAILFTIKPTLALAMVIPMVGMGVTMKLLTGRLHSFSVAVQESIASISHRAQENFGGIRIVKGYAREDQQARLFEATSAENRDNQVELGKARGLTHAAVNASFDLTFAVILLIGGLAAVDRTLPIGDLFKFIDLTMKVFWPLIAIGWVLGMLPRAIASAERVQELLDEENPIEDGEASVASGDVRGAPCRPWCVRVALAFVRRSWWVPGAGDSAGSVPAAPSSHATRSSGRRVSQPASAAISASASGCHQPCARSSARRCVRRWRCRWRGGDAGPTPGSVVLGAPTWGA